jgi:hypothetical protein
MSPSSPSVSILTPTSSLVFAQAEASEIPESSESFDAPAEGYTLFASNKKKCRSESRKQRPHVDTQKWENLKSVVISFTLPKKKEEDDKVMIKISKKEDKQGDPEEVEVTLVSKPEARLVGYKGTKFVQMPLTIYVDLVDVNPDQLDGMSSLLSTLLRFPPCFPPSSLPASLSLPSPLHSCLPPATLPIPSCYPPPISLPSCFPPPLPSPLPTLPPPLPFRFPPLTSTDIVPSVRLSLQPTIP